MKFAAGVLMRGARNDRVATTWEYRILLVDAISDDEASEKAAQFARVSEVEYPTDDDVEMRWRFEMVHHIQQIDLVDLRNGSEIFSIFLKESEAISLMSPFDDE